MSPPATAGSVSLCQQRGLDPVLTYADLAQKYAAPMPKGPFNLSARRAAGFSDTELAALCGATPQPG